MSVESNSTIWLDAVRSESRGKLSVTFQTIPELVADYRVKPPKPSIVLTSAGSAGFLKNMYLMPYVPITLDDVIPEPVIIASTASAISLGVPTVTSGSPSSKSDPLVMKYKVPLSVFSITKVFGLAEVSLSEDIKAGITLGDPLFKMEFAPTVIAQIEVSEMDIIVSKVIIPEIKCPKPNLDVRRFGKSSLAIRMARGIIIA